MSEDKKLISYTDPKDVHYHETDIPGYQVEVVNAVLRLRPATEPDPLIQEVAAIMGSKPVSELARDILARFNVEQPAHDGKWRLVPEDTYPAAVKFVLKSPDMDMEATTKWDGCTDLLFTEKSANGDEEMCYHHICDLDLFIARLQEMRAKARAYFDGEFSVAPLTDEQRQQKMVVIQQEEQT